MGVGWLTGVPFDFHMILTLFPKTVEDLQYDPKNARLLNASALVPPPPPARPSPHSRFF